MLTIFESFITNTHQYYYKMEYLEIKDMNYNPNIILTYFLNSDLILTSENDDLILTVSDDTDLILAVY